MRLLIASLLLLLGCSILSDLYGQVIPPNAPRTRAEALRELEKIGVTEEEFTARLRERGVDADNFENLPPSEQARQAAIIQEVYNEFKAQQRTEDIKTEVQEAGAESAAAAADPAPIVPAESLEPEETLAAELVEAINEDLPKTEIYGQTLFRNQQVELFTSNTTVRPDDDYILGTGDEITIAINGASLLNSTLTINNEGYVSPGAGLPRVYLRGLTWGNARDLLRRTYATRYLFSATDPGQFIATINFSRDVTISITGEVNNYGTFTLPATNTAFNALVVAGGPSPIGSVRDIRIVSNDGSVKRLDVYKFLQDPTINGDYYLSNGDKIFVDVIGKVISVNGAVRRPLKYELLEEENLRDLITYAGGLTENAYRTNIRVRRFVDDEQVIIDVDLRDLERGNSDFKLLRGDVVNIPTIPGEYRNYYEVTGAVELPGEYELKPNTRLLDALDRGELSEEANLDRVPIRRYNTDGTVTYLNVDVAAARANPTDDTANPILRRRDRVIVYAQERFEPELKNVAVTGAVRTPGEYFYSENLRVSDLLYFTGGLSENAVGYAYIYRRNEAVSSDISDYVRVDLRAALENPGSAADVKFMPGDRLRVFGVDDFIEDATISIQGEVREPIDLDYSERLTLSDALTLSRGLTRLADRDRIDIFRIEIVEGRPVERKAATVSVGENNVVEGQEITLQPFDIVIVRRVPEYDLQPSVTLSGEVMYPGKYVLLSTDEKLQSVIERAGGLTSDASIKGMRLRREENNTGFIILDYEEVVDDPNSKFNYVLRRGDEVTIPKREFLVTIQGAVVALTDYSGAIASSGRLNAPYEQGKSIEYYVEEYAAGYNDKASKNRVTVTYPNGQVKKVRNYGFFRVYPKLEPGAVINVGTKPVKVERERKKSEPVNWTEVATTVTAQVTAILTILVLANNIN